MDDNYAAGKQSREVSTTKSSSRTRQIGRERGNLVLLSFIVPGRLRFYSALSDCNVRRLKSFPHVSKGPVLFP
jgi:hypothetical protein